MARVGGWTDYKWDFNTSCWLALLYCTELHCTALVDNQLHCTSPHGTVQHCTVQHYTALDKIGGVVYSTLLHCNELFGCQSLTVFNWISSMLYEVWSWTSHSFLFGGRGGRGGRLQEWDVFEYERLNRQACCAGCRADPSQSVLCPGQSRYLRTGSLGKNHAEPDPEPPENLSQF